MTTLLLRLAGPMQSWGVQSRFEIRDTLTEPTKSGVIGLVCAALGRRREEAIDDLAALRMGVRVDREGMMKRDYHTALDIAIASGKKNKDCQPSQRFFLADARFLVGLEGENSALLHRIYKALTNPYWPLSLGRKGFVPGEPIYLKNGICEGPLIDSLRRFPWEPGERRQKAGRLRYIIESDVYDRNFGESQEHTVRFSRPDQPLSFQPRKFGMREVVVRYFSVEAQEVNKHVSQ